MAQAKKTKPTTRFQCQECQHTFRSTAAAERASFGPEGCPNCGGADIDEAPIAQQAKAS